MKYYRLDTFIPVFVRNLKSEERMKTDLCIEMEHNEKSVKRTYRLLGGESSVFDMEAAFVEIQVQLKGSYCMETCSNCRNSFWNPYGGCEFFNQLCFRSEEVLRVIQPISPKIKEYII